MAGLDEAGDEQEAVSKHLGGMRERMAAAKEETDEVSVEAPEAEEEEDEEPEAPSQTRQEKRSSRQSARERLAAAEAREQVLREQLEASRRPAPGDRPNPAAANLADVDKRIKATYAELERLDSEYARAQQDKTLTPALEAEMRGRAQELDIRKLELAAERREIQTAPRRQQDELSRQLARDNADVYGNQRALQYAAGRVNQLIAMGRQDSKELHDEVMVETRRVVLGVREKPGAIEKQRATGMSAGPRTAAPSGGKTIAMPRGSHYYKMAVAMYPDLDAGAACQKWAQKVGKNLLNKG